MILSDIEKIKYLFYKKLEAIDDKRYYFDVSDLFYKNGFFNIYWLISGKQIAVATQDVVSKDFILFLSQIVGVCLDDNRVVIEFRDKPRDIPQLILSYRYDDCLDKLAKKMSVEYNNSFKEALSYLRELQEYFPDTYDEKKELYGLNTEL